MHTAWINILFLIVLVVGCKTPKNITYTDHPIIVKDTFTVHLPHIHIDNIYCVPPETFTIIMVDTLFVDIYK